MPGKLLRRRTKPATRKTESSTIGIRLNQIGSENPGDLSKNRPAIGPEVRTKTYATNGAGMRRRETATKADFLFVFEEMPLVKKRITPSALEVRKVIKAVP